MGAGCGKGKRTDISEDPSDSRPYLQENLAIHSDDRTPLRQFSFDTELGDSGSSPDGISSPLSFHSQPSETEITLNSKTIANLLQRISRRKSSCSPRSISSKAPYKPSPCSSIVMSPQQTPGSSFFSTSSSQSPSTRSCQSMVTYDCDFQHQFKAHGNQTVIFIFGGPGSRKGNVIDNIQHTYNFEVITTEQVMLEVLPKMIGRDGLHRDSKECYESYDGTITNRNRPQYSYRETRYRRPSRTPQSLTSISQQIKEWIKAHPGQLTLAWILQEIIKAIATSKENNFIIDILPNFQFMFETPSFDISTCESELQQFEEKYPCLFALYLEVSEDYLQNSIRHRKDIEKVDSEENFVRSEIDTYKLQRRLRSFLRTIRPFLHYFKETHRLVNVDATGESSDHIWTHINDLLRKFYMVPKAPVHVFVMFTTEGHKVEIDIQDTNKVLKLNPEDKPYTSLNEMLDDLGKVTAVNREPLFIICDLDRSVCVTKPPEHKMQKQLKFLEVGKGLWLDEYISAQDNHWIVVNRTGSYKAMALQDNVTAIFPRFMTNDTCKALATSLNKIFAMQNRVESPDVIVEVPEGNEIITNRIN